MKTKDQTEIKVKGNTYLDHLSKEENETLDVIADIIAGYVLRKADELNEGRKRQAELNRHCTGSE